MNVTELTHYCVLCNLLTFTEEHRNMYELWSLQKFTEIPHNCCWIFHYVCSSAGPAWATLTTEVREAAASSSCCPASRFHALLLDFLAATWGPDPLYANSLIYSWGTETWEKCYLKELKDPWIDSQIRQGHCDFQFLFYELLLSLKVNKNRSHI